MHRKYSAKGSFFFALFTGGTKINTKQKLFTGASTETDTKDVLKRNQH